MEKEEKFYYETIKTPFKRIFLLLVVLFWVIPTVVMMTFRLEMAAQITISISSLMLFCGFCGGFYAKQKMEYGAITISEDYKTLTLFRNNLPVKVIYNNCIARVDLNITNMSIHCIDGEVVKLKLDADDVIDLYVQIFKKVSDVDPIRQKAEHQLKKFDVLHFLILLGLFGLTLSLTIPDLAGYWLTHLQPQIVEQKQEQKPVYDFISLNINPPVDYDYVSREEIFNLRKKYVNNSLFASKFYRPSNEVFGAIEGNKPWYGENIACPFSAKDITAGYSARSIYVNNPAILVGAIQTLGYKYPQDTPFCKNKLLNFMPQKILYSKKNNLLIVRYNADNSLINNIQEPQYGMPLGFVGLNARDLGYKYGFAASNRNIIYKERNNISKNVYKFRDFLHTGGSCRVPGGCTNTSPLQPEMDFFIQELPAEITFKLWKNEPQSPNEKADILYKVIFD